MLSYTTKEALSLQELLGEQSPDSEFQAGAKQSDTLPHATYKCNGILITTASIDRALEKVVPVTLRVGVLYLSHYPTLPGHGQKRRMYSTRRCESPFFWPHIANAVYTIVHKCCSWAQKGSHVTHKQKIQLFIAAGPRNLVDTDILGPLPRTMTGNIHVYIIADRLSKLTRVILAPKIIWMQIATILLDNWVMTYGISSYLLTDNGSHYWASFLLPSPFFWDREDHHDGLTLADILVDWMV